MKEVDDCLYTSVYSRREPGGERKRQCDKINMRCGRPKAALHGLQTAPDFGPASIYALWTIKGQPGLAYFMMTGLTC